MQRMARRISLTLVAACAVTALAAPLAAASKEPPAGQEYNLELPGSGAGSQTTAGSSNADTGSSDSGGFPIIAVVLIAGAGIAAGFAAWRLRKPGGPRGPDDAPPPQGGGD